MGIVLSSMFALTSALLNAPFTSAMPRRLKLSADQLEELKKAFAAIDANGDGVISKDELSTLLKGLGEDVGDDVVTEMMNLADTDGDGKVNFEEFCKAASS